MNRPISCLRFSDSLVIEHHKKFSMKYITFLLLLGYAIAFSSCNENSFSQVVEIDIPPHEPALSVRALFQQNDTLLSLLLTDSKGILESTSLEIQKEATVRLFENEQALPVFSYNPNSSRFTAPIPSGFEQAESTYRLEISAPNFKTISATQTMPKPVSILAGKYTPNGTFSSEGDRVDAIEIEFQDPSDEENYYAISAVERVAYFNGQDTSYYDSEIYLESNDPLVSFGTAQLLLLSDVAFNGNTYKVLLYSYNKLQEGEIKIQLLSVSRDTYLYHRSLSNYYDAQDNPFAEPVNVHQNIENGHGIFGLMAVSEILIK